MALAVAADLHELADVAARTFPLACPSSVSADNVAAFIADNLSEHRLREYLADPDRLVLAARDNHGAGVSAALMTAALRGARDLRAHTVWLGVNQKNLRAQRFYGKHGFTISGTKTFRLGQAIENDYVMVCPL